MAKRVLSEHSKEHQREYQRRRRNDPVQRAIILRAERICAYRHSHKSIFLFTAPDSFVPLAIDAGRQIDEIAEAPTSGGRRETQSARG